MAAPRVRTARSESINCAPCGVTAACADEAQESKDGIMSHRCNLVSAPVGSRHVCKAGNGAYPTRNQPHIS